ncbi:hypothetical protein VP01_1309g8 [Puccinia sorghi]|uniref:Uncharacterized protein n=1 Tax=Puccinia sorghi TaxID=27349 RepID=A0A0L6VMY8_9BASI|nr:hypothetical protein VP01_1309g8 [Puccinia sorghi]
MDLGVGGKSSSKHLEWKKDNLSSIQLQDDPTAFQAYRQAVGELLNHQQSHL